MLRFAKVLRMADITGDMINSFFNLSKPIATKPKVVTLRGPPPVPDNSYNPEFKLVKKKNNSR